MPFAQALVVPLNGLYLGVLALTLKMAWPSVLIVQAPVCGTRYLSTAVGVIGDAVVAGLTGAMSLVREASGRDHGHADVRWRGDQAYPALDVYQ